MNISCMFKYSSHLHFSRIKSEIFLFNVCVHKYYVFMCLLEGGRIYAHKLSFQGQIVKCNCY